MSVYGFGYWVLSGGVMLLPSFENYMSCMEGRVDSSSTPQSLAVTGTGLGKTSSTTFCHSWKSN